MDFGKLLNKSWEFTSKYRHLWWLSLLAVLGGVASEGQGIPSFNFNFGSPDDKIIRSLEKGSDEAIQFFLLYLPIIITIAVIVLLIGIALFILGLIAKGGLIQEIINIEHKKTSSFLSAFNQGKKYALNIFLTRLLFALIIIAFTIVSIPVMLILFLFFFITIPLFFVCMSALGLLSQNAQTLLVMKNIGPIDALKASWQLLLKEWKNMLFMWLINLGFSVVLGIVLLIIFIFIIGVLSAIVIFLAILKNTLLIILIVAPVSIILFAVMVFIGSLINTFFTSFWTLGINQLISPKIKAVKHKS